MENSVRLLFPVPSHGCHELLQRIQYERIHGQVPYVYLAGIFNILVVTYILQINAVPAMHFILPLILIIFCSIRVCSLLFGKKTTVNLNVNSKLKYTTIIAAGLTGLASAGCLLAYYDHVVANPIFIPISLSLGAFCIAHCLAPLRTAPILVLCIGTFPVSLALVLSGDITSIACAVSIFSAACLQIRVINEQYIQMIASLILEQKIRDLAHTDELTHLPNRRAFMQIFEAEIADNPDGAFGLAVLDLDGFKAINDKLGHLVGDAVLRIVGERLRNQLQATDYVGRIGGDEFIILFRSAENILDISARATGVLAALCTPAHVDAATIPIMASLGFALFPENGRTSNALISAADQALYSAKQNGKSQVKNYSPISDETKLHEMRAA
jgi:diguanylate cyclase